MRFADLDPRVVWRLLGMGRALLPGTEGADPQSISDIRILQSESYKVRLYRVRFFLHWLFHNAFAHPLMAIIPCNKTTLLHDASAGWMMGEHHIKKIRESAKVMHVLYGNHLGKDLADPMTGRSAKRGCTPGGLCCSSERK